MAHWTAHDRDSLLYFRRRHPRPCKVTVLRCVGLVHYESAVDGAARGGTVLTALRPRLLHDGAGETDPKGQGLTGIGKNRTMKATKHFE